jgi:pyrimidine operon attenuation protein/uracil phosphoribosyltransferase
MPKLPPAPELCKRLADLMRPHVTPATALVGIHTGGVWVAEWLHKELGLTQPLGTMNVSFYRDDYSQRGLHAGRKPSSIPFDVADAHIVIVDDVLYTGRTIRAALNELFDYGRPAKVELAVLADRGGRELPVAATYCPHTLTLPAAQSLNLERNDDGSLAFTVVEK